MTRITETNGKDITDDDEEIDEAQKSGELESPRMFERHANPQQANEEQQDKLGSNTIGSNKDPGFETAEECVEALLKEGFSEEEAKKRCKKLETNEEKQEADENIASALFH